LFESAFQIGKLLLPYDSRDRIEGEKLLLEGAVFVNAEFDAVAGQQSVDIIGALEEFIEIYQMNHFFLP